MKTKQIWFSELCTCTASTEQQQTNQFNVVHNIGSFLVPTSQFEWRLSMYWCLLQWTLNINSSFFQECNWKRLITYILIDDKRRYTNLLEEEESCMASFNIYEIKMESVKSEMWCSDLYKYGYGVFLFRLWLTLVILWELNMNHSHDLSKQMIS